MLTNIHIKNIILINNLEINFASGFGVLTGETGAGKSILLGALGFVLGARSGSGLLRAGEQQGSVVACFNINGNEEISKILADNSIPHHEELVLRRVLSADGKSRAFVNDVTVGVALLANIAAYLVEIHGQHDQRGLQDSSNHCNIIDKYGQLEAETAATRNCFSNYQQLKQQLLQLQELSAKSAAEEDYLAYVLKELEELNPQNGEETKLALQRSSLMNSEKITGAVSAASDLLSSNTALNIITKAQGLLYDAAKAEPRLQNIIEGLERAAIEVAEANAILDNILSKIDNGGKSLENIEERLFALRAAARKHRISAEELPVYLENIRQKFAAIKNKESLIDEITAKLVIARSQYLQTAKNLSDKRKIAAEKFQQELLQELQPLKMENTRFIVNIETSNEDSWNSDGIDKVNFLVSTNPGSPPAPLAKIASGGELSRFMLAMKVVLSAIKSVPTLIFDEIDTGIGGSVADAVGRRMEKLGQNSQVLAVTHQPQVAARSSFHLKIAKQVIGNNTVTTVEELHQKQKTNEIARMLAGEIITTEAISAAAKLLETA